MPRNQKDSMYDHALLMKDAGLVAADAAATVSASARILDLGLSRMDGRVIIDTTAVEAATDERYDICWQLSNSATFASGVIGQGIIALGHSSTLIGESASSPAAGRYELGVTNEVNGTVYRYARLYTNVTGTIATGINYVGRLVQES